MRALTPILLAVCAGLPAQQRPNVILMMADDLGYGDMGCQGHPTLKTPHLDAMAAGGLRFTRFYSSSPVCSPTRASCLTGRYPVRLGIPGANSGHLPADENNLALVLKEKGYATGHFGKWHLGTLTKKEKDSNRGGPRGVAHYAPPWDRGFDTCFSTEAKVPTYDPMVHPDTGKPYGTAYWVGEETKATGDLSGDDSELIMDHALPFVREAAKNEQPFFAVIWFHAPHLPCVASAEDRALYPDATEKEQHYWGCITALDRQVGRLRKELRDLGVADDTMVWFCSDNGPEGKDGKAPGTTGGLRGRKRSLFEGGVRVPGIVEWPAVVKPGTVTDTPAWTCDYWPTVVAAVGSGAKPKGDLDGVDLGSLLRGERLAPREMVFLSGRQSSWLSGHNKLVEQRGNVMPFDLREQPGEREPLEGENSKLWQFWRLAMAKKLDAYRQERKALKK